MSGYDPNSFRMGVEYEYQLITADGRPQHWQDLSFPQLKDLIARSNAPRNAYMAVKYPGSDQRSFYLEGYDLTDEQGDITDLHVKGIEISTPIAADVYEQQEYLVQHYQEMQALLAGIGLTGSAYGAHATPGEYRGPRGGRGVEGWAAAETAMMTWGIHVNVSFPEAVEAELDRDYLHAKFDWFGPALILLSANTPVRGDGPWTVDGVVGKSERSWRRSFTRRPLYFRDDQYFRKEVTCFDITHRLDLVRGYTALVAGLMLEKGDFDHVASPFADHNMRQAALHGYQAPLLNRHFEPVDGGALVDDALARAAKGLADQGLDTAPLDALRALAEGRRCPADDTLDTWYAQPDWASFLRAHADLTGH
ncbi:glutamate-cysteine ligase family protein [Streptomyces sp. NPDC049590]|uniref:glutamate-cysteine ligase family protein n=1 Tax=Streptomyces sp. NPDC049590 TaxID=3154834 RepID=UPI0034207D4D